LSLIIRLERDDEEDEVSTHSTQSNPICESVKHYRHIFAHFEKGFKARETATD
jgi:hypothetical protein